MIDSPDLLVLRAAAIEAADAGASVVTAHARGPALSPEWKGDGDYVTAADRQSEDAIREILDRATPGIPVLGEEGGGGGGHAYWAVDPLDGTTNFLLGFPAVGVSVGLVIGGVVEVAAVRAPLLGLGFEAARGHGAWAGDRRLRVSSRPPRRAVVATGFPFRRKDRLARYLPAMQRVLEGTEDLRRPGAACLDLAWVAAGVFDGFYELGLAVWDVAAGSLLVQEAGGTVTDWSGGRDFLSGDILAGPPATHALLVEATRSEPC